MMSPLEQILSIVKYPTEDPRPPTPSPTSFPAKSPPGGRLLTAAEFHRLADVPPKVEWFANLTNPQTRNAYEHAVGDFMRFAGIARLEEFRAVARAHVIAWRDQLVGRGLGGSTVRHRLASLAPCSNTSVARTPSPTTRSRACSAEGRER